MKVSGALTTGFLIAGIAVVGWVWMDRMRASRMSSVTAVQGRGAGLLRPDDAALVALGEKVYARACANCHGANLEGQAGWRNRRGLAPAHDESGHTWHHPDYLLVQFVRDGTVRVGGTMPAFGGTLSERDILAVLSFIKSRWPARIREAHDSINARAGGRG